ncbi:zinc-binding dehydrogenase [Amnibacterium flavum]|uniref:Alcohol dehydrogenase n=1 Tax=Amnibacterium flavum TaxID=2173173 RepID=A0A2V1HRD8_9MICO|nr:alcohol dehydrogenase catalytic domain-containing protein [Amnibacterium flavum]PVZ95173.1 alcohol dehydrogenase [Amnibacterium flavum]
MRAFALTGPRQFEVRDEPDPVAGPGQVVVHIERVGVCGTDVEFFTGEMSYLHTGRAAYPMRLGHEWSGTVTSVGDGVDPAWLGRRTTGDTMLGCGRCDRCLSGRHHVCAELVEVGISGGFAGALAERLAVPASALHALPDAVDAVSGALVEPGGNALRALDAASLAAGDRLLVMGPGTIGLLTAQFAHAAGIEVHVLGLPLPALEFAKGFGFAGVWTDADLPLLPWDAVIDASNAAALPSRAVELVEPGRRVVFIGLAGAPSLVDSRSIALKDVTAVGILGASAGLDGTIDRFASGAVDPRTLVAATVGLERAGDVLGGWRPTDAGAGPKIHIDPRL